MKLGEFRKLTENLSDDVEINFFYETESWGSVSLWIELEDKNSQELNIKLESPEDFPLN